MNDKMKTAISIIAIACLCACTAQTKQTPIQPPRTAYTAPHQTTEKEIAKEQDFYYLSPDKQKEADFHDLPPDKQKEIDEYLARLDDALTEGKLLKEEDRDAVIRLSKYAPDDFLRGMWAKQLAHIKKSDALQILIDVHAQEHAPTKNQYAKIQQYFLMITARNEMLRRGLLEEISPEKSPWKKSDK